MAKEDKKESEELRDLRRQEAEITREIIDLREKLVALSKSDSANLREVQKVQESLLGLEKQKQGVQGQLYNQYGEILKSEQTHLDSMQKIVESQEDLLELTEETNEEYKKARAVKMELLDLEDELQTKYDAIQKDLSETIKSSHEYNFATDLIAQTTAAVQERVHGTSKEMIALGDATRKSLYTNIDLVDTLQDMDASAKAVREGKYVELSSYREELALKKTGRTLDLLKEDFERGSVKDAAGKTKYSQQDLDFLQKQIGIFEKQETVIGSMVAMKGKLNAENEIEAKKQAEIIQRTEELKGAIGETHFGKIFDGLESGIKKIPGGAALSKVLGFDTFKKNIQENVGKSLTGIATGFQGGMVSGLKASGQAVMGFGKALLMGPQAVIFGILAAVGALVAIFVSLDGHTSKIQKTFGGTKAEAEKTHHAAHKLAENMKVAGVNTEETMKAMESVSERMGGLDVSAVMQGGNKAMKQMVSDSAVLVEKFGLSAEEVGNIQTLATITGTSVGSLVNQTTKLGKGLLTDKAAMKTLAEIPKSVAIGFKGSTQELIKAAQKAKLLGTELGRMKEIGRGMLDIESSLGAEMEARVLTGKNINFDAARGFALAGEEGKLQDEILHQMGSMAEFKEMNLLQQESMAKAFGMSVDEMTGMLSKAEELRDLGLSAELLEQKQYQNAVGLREEAEKARQAGNGALADKLLSMAADKDSATMAEKLGDIMTKVKEKFEALLFPIVEMVHGLFDAKEAGGGIGDTFDNIFSAIKPVFDILTVIVKVVFSRFLNILKNAYEIISPIFEALGEIFSVFGGISGEAGGFGKALEAVGDVLNVITDIVGTIGKYLVQFLIAPIKGVLMGAIKPVFAVFQNLIGVFDELYTALKPIFEPLFAASEAGEKTFGIMDALQIPIKALGLAFEVMAIIFRGALLRPLNLFINLVKIAVRLFTGDFAGAATAVGDLLFDFFLGIPKMVAEAIAGAIDSIFGTNLTKSVGEFFGWIKGAFDDVGKFILDIFGGSILAIGGGILDFILAPFKLLWGIGEGIIKMFTGDFVGGLKQIGSAIGEFLFTKILGLPKLILSAITGIIDSIFGTNLTASVDNFFNFIKDGFKAFGSFLGDIGASIFKFIMRPFDLVKNIIGGIVQIFTGDFKGGLETIGKAILEYLMAPVTLVSDVFKKFVGLFESIGNKIKNAIKDLLPDWALKLLGMGSSEKEDASKSASNTKLEKMSAQKELEGAAKKENEMAPADRPVIGAAASGGVISKGGATLVGEKGPEVVSLPKGSVVASASATKQIGSAMGSMESDTAAGGESPEFAVLKSIDAKIGSLLEPMNKVGEAIGSAIKSVSSIAGMLPDVGGMVSSLFGGGESKPKSAADKASEYTATKATSITSIPETTVPTTTAAPPGANANLAPGGAVGKAKGGDGDGLGAKLDKLISIMESMATQPTIIKFGEKTVEEIQGKIDFKKAYNIAIDNTYGRRI